MAREEQRAIIEQRKTLWGMVHSEECTAILHGESLAGCIKVRWTDGLKKWFSNCCKGLPTPILNTNMDVLS